RPTARIGAPSACRYFGRKFFQRFSPSERRSIAEETATMFRSTRFFGVIPSVARDPLRLCEGDSSPSSRLGMTRLYFLLIGSLAEAGSSRMRAGSAERPPRRFWIGSLV